MDLKSFDIQIHLKNEDKIKRLLKLVLFTTLLSMVFFELLDYIWNIPLYKTCLILFNYIVAVPAVFAYIKRGKKIKDLFPGEKVAVQITIGLVTGIIMAFTMYGLSFVVDDIHVGKSYFTGIGAFIFYTVNYYLSVGPVEEFIFRVELFDELSELFGRFKWLAPLISAVMFSAWHLISASAAVYVAFAWGLVWGYGKLYIKNCTFLSVWLAHSTYDFALTLVPYLF